MTAYLMMIRHHILSARLATAFHRNLAACSRDRIGDETEWICRPAYRDARGGRDIKKDTRAWPRERNVFQGP
jgi:hypothetical protein